MADCLTSEDFVVAHSNVFPSTIRKVEVFVDFANLQTIWQVLSADVDGSCGVFLASTSISRRGQSISTVSWNPLHIMLVGSGQDLYVAIVELNFFATPAHSARHIFAIFSRQVVRLLVATNIERRSATSIHACLQSICRRFSIFQFCPLQGAV